MLDSTMQPKLLARAAAELGYPAAGLTDRGNLFAAMAFSQACLEVGVQPLIGVLLPVQRASAPRPGAPPPTDGLVLFAQNETGWRSLLALVSSAHLDGEPVLDALAGRTDGLLALTGGADGALARLMAEGQAEAARATLDRLLTLFPDRLFIEIGRSGEPVEAASEAALLELAHARGLPIVGTAIAKFRDPAGHQAHDVMRCIAEGAYLETEGRARSNPAQHLQHPLDAAARFADLPEAIANCALVAQRTAFAVGTREPVLPRLVDDPAVERQTLVRLAEEGLAARLAALPDADPAPYRARLAHELAIIADMGFAGYFLIVADFIGWARAQGIPVGPGRGSGAGSAVAWALRITDLDPLALGLLFERFLNPERRSMPDFDIDFCETRREEVIRYVQGRYGRDRVAQIITFGTLKARAVVKDVGRVLQLPYGQVDRLAKLIPANPADPWDLARALGEAVDGDGQPLPGVPELAAEIDSDPKVRHLIGIARQLEGLPRHSSTHAAGVVIADRPLAELVPLYRDPRSDMPVSQFDLKWAEAAGLVKFDFLGLKTLSVLARARALLAGRGIDFDPDRLPMDDAAVFALMTRGDTVGVFQFESEGMRRALAQVKPDRFEDIVALGALYRPGPMDNIASFAARKHGREPVDWLHPALEPVLEPTYGIIVYQEQVMQIAQILAGYSLGEADLLRRAMGKKKPAEMAAQRARFVEGAQGRGVAAARAEHIFDLVAKFAGYGFNKSHAAAYALVAWQTAFLKTHHPAAFFAASMAYDIGQTEKLAILVEDMGRMGVPLLPPCINRSQADFTLEEADGRLGVRYALGALKGVGEGAMAGLVAERSAHGPFRSLDDLAERIDPTLLNRRQVEALAAAGAFDTLGIDRAAAFAAAEALMAAAARAAEARATGQGGLFGGSAGVAAASVPVPAVEPWLLGERLTRGHAAFGFWHAGHPVDAHAALVRILGAADTAAIAARRGTPGSREPVLLAALVEDCRHVTPQGRGVAARYLIADCSDRHGRLVARCYEADTQALLLAAAGSGDPLLLGAELSWRDPDRPPLVTVRSVQRLDELARATRARLEIRLDAPPDARAVRRLQARLPRGGRSIVEVIVPLAADGAARLRLGTDFALPAGIVEDLQMEAAIAAAAIHPLKPALKLVA